jgi:WD40 repeat protein
MGYNVFISYRWIEPYQSWVTEQLVPALKKAGLSVCVDVEDFVPGRDLMLEMTRAESESQRLLCIIIPQYFDHNRMVWFESLMARRLDPAGSESRLIPFILLETKLPEWMRGLIPIVWTHAKTHAREWRKLLKTLGAPKPDEPIPEPLPDSAVSSSGEKSGDQATRELSGPIADGKVIATLEGTLQGHSNVVWDVIVTPNGRRVLSASNDMTVRIWDVGSRACLGKFAGHSTFVCSLALSSDGSTVASGAIDGTIKVWTLASCKEILSLKQKGADAKVGFTCKDKKLVSGGSDGVLTIWDLKGREATRSIAVHDGAILKTVCLQDDMHVVSVSSDKTIKVSRLADGSCKLVFRGHSGEVNSAAVSRDQTLLLSASEDASVRIWNLETGDNVATLVGHQTVVWRVAIAPDCSIAASGSGDNSVRLWDLKKYNCLQYLPHPECVAAVAFSPDGEKLFVGCDDKLVYVYRLNTSYLRAA